MHGYEMISELQQRTGGAWRPSPGSVYPTLQMLEEEGLITGEETEGRRQFTLTDAGREESSKQSTPPWTQITDEDGQFGSDLRTEGMGIFQAMGQVMAVGTDDQKQRAMEILRETRRKIYGILSE
jgi:DNA-binding PadR family transcriptional regulator